MRPRRFWAATFRASLRMRMLSAGSPAELLRMAAERGRIEEEGWRVRKDGSRFWADVRADRHSRHDRRS